MDREGIVEKQRTVVERKNVLCKFIEVCEWYVEYVFLVSY